MAGNIQVKKDGPSKGDGVKQIGMYGKVHGLNPEMKKHRTNIYEVMISSNATPIRRVTGDMGYECCYCNEQYQQPADLKRHTLDTHKDVKKAYFFIKMSMDRYHVKLDITDLQCKLCELNIESVESLMEHLIEEHKKILYKDVKNHIIPFKFNTETLQCYICLSTFARFKGLLEHMNFHYRNYICEFCDVGYYNFLSYKAHKGTHNIKTYPCQFCTQVCPTKNAVIMHERQWHRNKIVFKCGYCKEIFNTSRKKEDHLVAKHGLKIPTPRCQACDKIFANRRQLRLHILRVHLMEKLHKCTECDKSFCSRGELRNHSLKHTGTKVHKCIVCCKYFGRANTLKEHMKIHNDVRKFKCEHCGQAFIQKCSWRGHMKNKHGELV